MSGSDAKKKRQKLDAESRRHVLKWVHLLLDQEDWQVSCSLPALVGKPGKMRVAPTTLTITATIQPRIKK